MRLIRGFLSMAIRQKTSQADAALASPPPGPKPSALADFTLARLRNRGGFDRCFCAGK
jgi:hypothetical protein